MIGVPPAADRAGRSRRRSTLAGARVRAARSRRRARAASCRRRAWRYRAPSSTQLSTSMRVALRCSNRRRASTAASVVPRPTRTTSAAAGDCDRPPRRRSRRPCAGGASRRDERRDPAERGLLVRNSAKLGRASAFAIAVATSSVNASIRRSASVVRGSGRVRAAITAPHSRPSTTIGLPLPVCTPARAKALATEPGGPGERTARAAERVFLDGDRDAVAFHRKPCPYGKVLPRIAEPADDSCRALRLVAKHLAISASESRATSSATAAKSASAEAAWADERRGHPVGAASRRNVSSSSPRRALLVEALVHIVPGTPHGPSKPLSSRGRLGPERAMTSVEPGGCSSSSRRRARADAGHLERRDGAPRLNRLQVGDGCRAVRVPDRDGNPPAADDRHNLGVERLGRALDRR